MPTTKKAAETSAHGHGQDKKEKKAAMAHPHKGKEATHQPESATMSEPGAIIANDTEKAPEALSRAAQRKAKHVQTHPEPQKGAHHAEKKTEKHKAHEK